MTTFTSVPASTIRVADIIAGVGRVIRVKHFPDLHQPLAVFTLTYGSTPLEIAFPLSSKVSVRA